MKALLLIAHGSNRQESNQEIQVLAEKLAVASCGFDLVQCAFLELTQPSIPSALEDLVRHGADDITAIPYFLAAGRHVVTDIPEQLNRFMETHKDITIRQTAYIGQANGIVDMLLDLLAGGAEVSS
jgi:sirohydrochlorin ferrochelatase